MKAEYYHTKESVAEYISAAKGFDGANLISKLEHVLPVNSKLLELGSGPGKDWEILSNNYNVVGSDNSTTFLNHLIDQNPKGKFIKLDASTLTTNKKFDGIYSNKVMHHLKDNELIESIKNQYKILNTDGIICHSFWKGEGSEIFKGLFVNYHNKQNLRALYENSFDILTLELYKEFEDGDSILLIAKKK